MDFEALASLNWREGLIAIIALLAVYVVVAFLRIRRLKRDAVAPVADRFAAQSASAAYAAMQEPALSEASALPGLPAAPAAPAEASFAWNEPPPGAAGQQMFEALERELTQLRKEVGSLRAEVLVLREEQRRELAQSRVPQNVSPLYSDAMQMAMRGHDAASIAQHCGIARAEAELVVALVRNQDARDS
jgi:hypothetical protein